MTGYFQRPLLIYLFSGMVLSLQLSGCWFSHRPATEKPAPSGDPVAIAETAAESESVSPETADYEVPRAELQPYSAYEGPKVDNASFDYPWWVHLATSKISRSLHLPHGLAKNLTCQIFLQVNRDGELVALRMIRPSGSTAFDKACLEAIRWAEPFPSLPEDYQNDRIGLTVPFRSK